jgi:hypothetical protein
MSFQEWWKKMYEDKKKKEPRIIVPVKEVPKEKSIIIPGREKIT